MERVTVSPSRLLVKNQTKEKVTKSGIILPKTDETKETPQVMEVVALGVLSTERFEVDFNEKNPESMQVVIPKYAGVTIEIDSEEMKVIEYDDVLALIKE